MMVPQRYWFPCTLVGMLTVFGTVVGYAQRDAGIRHGPPGNPLPDLTPVELALFDEGLQRAIQLEAFCDGNRLEPQ
jgi:hypothetical protein